MAEKHNLSKESPDQTTVEATDQSPSRVVTTNLGLRFYWQDGWRERNLEQYVVHGTTPRFRFFDDRWQHGGDSSYWTPNVGTRVDVEKLLRDGIQVQRTYNDAPGESDAEHLTKHNW